MKKKNLIYRVVPAAGSLVYLAMTVMNFNLYVTRTVPHFSSGYYDSFLVKQMFLNPMVRVPDAFWGFFSLVIEGSRLSSFLDGPQGVRIGYFLFTMSEIAILDFLVGTLCWYLALALGCSLLLKMSYPTLPNP